MDHRSAETRHVERVRGRRAVKLRLARLKREPLCRHCLKKGVVRAATVPDHIVPLAFGGSDTDDNIQCLCFECHAIKTATEGASQGGSDPHPDWLRQSAIPLTIVCGPPCSGKTTYITERADPADVVIDIDSIARRLMPSYQHWQGMLSDTLLTRAIRARNEMLGSLSRMGQGKAWFIVSAPTKAERDWWLSKLGGEVVLLHPGVPECERRAVARGTPNAIAGIRTWEMASRRGWQSKTIRRKTVIGVDGYPIDPNHPANR